VRLLVNVLSLYSRGIDSMYSNSHSRSAKFRRRLVYVLLKTGRADCTCTEAVKLPIVGIFVMVIRRLQTIFSCCLNTSVVHFRPFINCSMAFSMSLKMARSDVWTWLALTATEQLSSCDNAVTGKARR